MSQIVDSWKQQARCPESGDAAWSRVRLIPFTAHISDAERDIDLPSKLKEAAPAILAWLVRGCLAWQREGLKVPECMQEARQDYRNEQDTFQAFLDDCYGAIPDTTVPLKEVLARYSDWRMEEPDAQA